MRLLICMACGAARAGSVGSAKFRSTKPNAIFGRGARPAPGRLLSDNNDGSARCRAPDACGCDEGFYCNFDYGVFGGCEQCSRHDTLPDCYNDGLSEDGAVDCELCCFPTLAPTATPAPTMAPTISAAPTATFAPTFSPGSTCDADYRPSCDLDLAPNGTTNWGTCRGRCVSGLNEGIGKMASPASCWEACVSRYGDEVVAINWGYEGWCFCQDDCKSVAMVWSTYIYTITRDSAVDKLPTFECGNPESVAPEDLIAEPDGTTNWGSGVGRCRYFGGRVKLDGCVTTPVFCYENCFGRLGDNLAAITWDPIGSCVCYEFCECMQPELGWTSERILITRNSKFSELPEVCDDDSRNKKRKGSRALFIALLIGGPFLALLLCVSCVARRYRRRKQELERERAVIVEEQTTAASDQVKEFQAHFVTVSGTCFMSFDRLRPQEEMRDEIIIYDSVADVRDASARGEVFIFFSHQWLGWSEPDPERVHVAAMQQAVKNVSKDTETPLEKLRIWVDYVSIPQRNRGVQKLAIASLPTFASCADYFVVVAPDATHRNTGCTCNSRSYRRRAWCRAEIFACWARQGTSDMYYNTNEGLKPLVVVPGVFLWSCGGDDMSSSLPTQVSDEILAEALDVISGEFTCCRLGHPNEDPCDREALMLPLLGLYADIYRERDGKYADAYAFIEPIKDRLFPATFDYLHRSSDGVETTTSQLLFGDLVAAVEYATDRESSGASKETSDATIQSPPDNTRACCLSDWPARDVAVVAFWLVCSVMILVVMLLVKEVLAGIVLIPAGTLVLAYFWAASNFCGTSTPDFKPGTNAQRH